jgi:hypothetical protein
MLSVKLNMFFFTLSRYNLPPIHLAYCLLSSVEMVKFHMPPFAFMNLHNGPPDKSNNNGISKAIAAMPIVGILVASALLLSGLSLIGSETAMAQQNMTAANATAANATAANATG